MRKVTGEVGARGLSFPGPLCGLGESKTCGSRRLRTIAVLMHFPPGEKSKGRCSRFVDPEPSRPLFTTIFLRLTDPYFASLNFPSLTWTMTMESTPRPLWSWGVRL